MLEKYVHDVTQVLQNHPHYAWVAAFFIAFTESLAIIGSIVPGSVTMTAVGALIGAAIIPAGSTIGSAILGALTGDLLSFWFGHHYKSRLRNIWPLNRHPKLLNKGEVFFQRYGILSIIIGRFVGPIRSMIPMIAGMLKFPLPKFILAAVPSASAWAVVYMVPGILIGAVSLELPPHVATKFILYALGLIILIWALIWLVIKSTDKLIKVFNNQSKKLWLTYYQHKPTSSLINYLSNHKKNNDHHQIIRLIGALTCFVLFTILAALVVSKAAWLQTINFHIFYLVRSFRTHIADLIFLSISTLLSTLTIPLTAGVISVYFIYHKLWRTLKYWLILVIASIASVGIFKYILNITRPIGLLHGPTSPSFPSGHTTLTIAIIGFIIVLIGNNNRTPKDRTLTPYWVILSLTFTVGFSRLYLGVHWLTDIIGATLLGLGLLLTISVNYYRKDTPNIYPAKLLTVTLASLLVLFSTVGIHQIKQKLITYQPSWPATTITTSSWWNQQTLNQVPLYRNNRLGKPIQALNIQWYGKLSTIRQQLKTKHWKLLDSQNKLKTIIANLNTKPSTPLLDPLYQGMSPSLIATKPYRQSLLILHIWPTANSKESHKSQLWLGNLSTSIPHHKTTNKTKFKGYIGVARPLTASLNPLHWQLIKITKNNQPQALKQLDWNGDLLLIKN